MPTAFSYLRFSSAGQGKGSSLARQKAMVAEWLRNHPEYSVSEASFEDLGRSGFVPADAGSLIESDHLKNAFGRLLEAVKSGVIKSGDCILIEAIDRAGRLNPSKMMTLLMAIVDAGVFLISLDDGIVYDNDPSKANNMFLLLAKVQQAYQYSDALSRRLKASYETRRKAAAEGQTPKRLTPAWLTSHGMVIPEVAAQVKLAFELYASGLGKTVIAKRMRESGVPALAKCSGPGVEGWLRNETAIGRWKGSNVYEPIIDISLFHRAQIEAAKRKTAPRIKTATHFLVGLVKCGCCGHNFIMRTIRGVQVSMRCRKRQELQGCENIRVIPKEIIDAVYRYTSARAAREAIAQERTGVNETAILAAEAKLLTLNKQAEDLAAAIREIGPVPEVLNQLRAANDERTETQGALAMLKATVVPVAADGWLQQGKVWAMERNDPQRLAAMLRGVGYSMTVHLDKTITSTHSDTTYRFASVDRKSGSYRLYVGEELILIPKGVGDDNQYSEPFTPDEPASSTWDDADYENLRAQYE